MKKYSSHLINFVSNPTQLLSCEIRNEETLQKQQYDLDTIKHFLLKTPSYIIVAEGMGCYSIIRRKSQQDSLEAFFVDSDDTNDLISKCMEGYTMVNTKSVICHEWSLSYYE